MFKISSYCSFLFLFVLVVSVVTRNLVYIYVILPSASSSTSSSDYNLVTFGTSAKAHKQSFFDEYDPYSTPCEDFYSKVCSLSDPSGNKTMYSGTFKDMMDANEELVKHIIIHSFGKDMELCDAYVRMDYNTTMYDTYQFVMQHNITTFFDVWLHGGSVPFKISSRNKVFSGLYYAVEFDIDFSLYFKISEDPNIDVEFLETISKYYDLLDIDSYPQTMDQYLLVYQQVKELDSVLQKFLIALGLDLEDWVTFNKQQEFFKFMLTTRASSKTDVMLLTYLMQLNKHKESGIALTKRALLYKSIETKKKKIFNLQESGNFVDVSKYCKKRVREIRFAALNYKYTELIQSVNSNEGDMILSLVDKIRSVSYLFFKNKTTLDFSMYNEKEFVLNTGQDESEFAAKKMQYIEIFTMAKTPVEIKKQELIRENQYMERHTSSWIELYHMGKKYRNTLTVLEDMKHVRSKDYITLRSDQQFNLRYLWITVKAETVNAWYNPTQNNIVIPYGITRFPMFRGDFEYDLPFLGSVIGHEIGHATDSSGKNFDHYGNYIFKLAKDANAKEDCLSDDYGTMCGNDNYGKHTLGEDMADQFGLRMVLFLTYYELLFRVQVLQYASNENNSYKEHIYDLYSGETRNEIELNRKTLTEDIFITFARLWCERTTVENECYNVENDVHALAKHRVTKTLRQFGSFKEIFQCRKSDSMVNEESCIVY